MSSPLHSPFPPDSFQCSFEMIQCYQMMKGSAFIISSINNPAGPLCSSEPPRRVWTPFMPNLPLCKHATGTGPSKQEWEIFIPGTWSVDFEWAIGGLMSLEVANWWLKFTDNIFLEPFFKVRDIMESCFKTLTLAPTSLGPSKSSRCVNLKQIV